MKIKRKLIAINSKTTLINSSNSTSYLNPSYLKTSLNIINQLKATTLLLKDNQRSLSSKKYQITTDTTKDSSSNLKLRSLFNKKPLRENDPDTYSKLLSFSKTTIPYIELKDFLINPLPINTSLICNMRVQTNTCLEAMYPKVILSLNHNDKIILNAKKQFSLSSIVYKLYLSNYQDYCIGILKSNIKGNIFKLYISSIDIFNSKIEKRLVCSIKYNKSICGSSKQPMQIQVTLPNKSLLLSSTKQSGSNKSNHSYGGGTNRTPEHNDKTITMRNRKPIMIII